MLRMGSGVCLVEATCCWALSDVICVPWPEKLWFASLGLQCYSCRIEVLCVFFRRVSRAEAPRFWEISAQSFASCSASLGAAKDACIRPPDTVSEITDDAPRVAAQHLSAFMPCCCGTQMPEAFA